jgi:putative membrane protein
MLLTEQDQLKVKAAVEAAEKRTSGEVVCVLARQSGDYLETPLAWAGGISMIVPAVALILGWLPGPITKLLEGWTIAHTGAVDSAVAHALTAYVVVQAILFIITTLIISIPSVRLALTPTALKREHVQRRAREQFAAQGMYLTQERTGLLVYASLAERQAVVIADQGVAAKLPAKSWDEVVVALTNGMKASDPGGGFAAAISKAADLMEGPLPRLPDDKNELPDTVIELL